MGVAIKNTIVIGRRAVVSFAVQQGAEGVAVTIGFRGGDNALALLGHSTLMGKYLTG
jgi:hypothetical protein